MAVHAPSASPYPGPLRPSERTRDAADAQASVAAHHAGDEHVLRGGSAFAKAFIETDRTHFAKEWAEAQHLSGYLAYAEQVLFSDERLFGGHAAWTQSRAVQASTVSLYSRDQTVRMFGKGELGYRETVLGGRVSVEPCKSTPLDWMHLDCLESNCRNLVIAPSKLQRVIKAQQVMVGKLHAVDETSVEYRIEAQVLQRLLDAREKLIKPEAA